MKLSHSLQAAGCSIKQKCMWCFPNSSVHNRNKEGIIVGFLEVTPYNYSLTCSGPNLKYSTNALVLAQTFCKGEILQLPLECVEVVDEYPNQE